MPKRLTDEQRGPLGAWLVREREARGWDQDSMAERLRSEGYGIRQDYYRQVEAGKKPGPELLAALERLFGKPYIAPPEPSAPAAGDMATAVLALIDEMREDRKAAQARTDDRDLLIDTIRELKDALGVLQERVEGMDARLRAYEAGGGLPGGPSQGGPGAPGGGRSGRQSKSQAVPVR